ncbi:SsrA-binding protein SmpB [Rugosimonospora acidiphila]|uniref:SsrA-binding protein n=1 Tax=Rugosimonospora acidiphila TaxID=556531 RepID=A0ABP9SB65_9ACTN
MNRGGTAASRGGAASGRGGAVTTRRTPRQLVASNRKARHDYTILKSYEAGIALLGTEVKSLRAGHASLVDAFAHEHDGELMLHGLHIPEYSPGSRADQRTVHQPRRTRKLLLHRVEIDRILDRLREAGIALVPLSLYFENGWAKVEIALARGRRSYDKRQAIAERDANREITRELSRHLKGQHLRARHRATR